MGFQEQVIQIISPESSPKQKSLLETETDFKDKYINIYIYIKLYIYIED